MNITQNNDLPTFTITSDWEARSRGLQYQYPLLADADLFYEKGKENELLCRLETRLNLNRDEVMILLQKDVIVPE